MMPHARGLGDDELPPEPKEVRSPGGRTNMSDRHYEQIKNADKTYQFIAYDGYDYTFQDSLPDQDEEGASITITPELAATDGRFIEKYLPLHLIATDDARSNILAYAQQMYWLEQKEDESSIEAIITRCLLHTRDDVVKGVIATKDVAEIFNQDRVKEKRWKTQSVGRIIGRLGFHAARTVTGSHGWIWDEKILEDNIARYNVTMEELPLGKGSNPSNPYTY